MKYLEMHTPSYLFDINEFHKQIGKVRQAWGEIGLCYSVKANPFLVGKTPEILDYLEVCSPGELEICAKRGVDPAKIIFSDLCKRRAAYPNLCTGAESV